MGSGTGLLPSPTKFCVEAINKQGVIVLSWTGVQGAAGYRIERKDKFGSSTTIDSLQNALSTRFVDASVLCGIPYIYTIYAFDAASESLPTSNRAPVTLLFSKHEQSTAGLIDIRLGDLLTENVSICTVIFLNRFNLYVQ